MNSPASVSHLDRLVTNATTGVTSAFAGGSTTWTLPYAVPVDGSKGTIAVVRPDTNVVLVSTRPAPNQVRVAGSNLTAVPVSIGLLYNFLYRLSPLYVRNAKGATDTRGTLQMKFLGVNYATCTDFTVTVTAKGRAPIPYVFSDPLASAAGRLQIPVQTRNTNAIIEISNDTPGSTRLVGLDWEGEYVLRNRAI